MQYIVEYMPVLHIGDWDIGYDKRQPERTMVGEYGSYALIKKKAADTVFLCQQRLSDCQMRYKPIIKTLTTVPMAMMAPAPAVIE